MKTALYLMMLIVCISCRSSCAFNNQINLCKGHIECSSFIKVSWYERRPYVYRKGNITRGILPDAVNLLLQQCCGNSSCWRVQHDEQPVSDLQKLLHGGMNNVTILYPALVKLQDTSSNTIGLIPTSWVAFVVPAKPQSFAMKLLQSVFDAWPILIFTFLLSIIAGIILWATELRDNPEQFPSSFIKGSWEGFWWAFVSMTTVGYGDRSPRSFLGRTFAVFWILLGICIVSIFTATLTTSMTTITMDTKKSITGSKIGVLAKSIELETAMHQQSDIEVFNRIEDIRSALDDKTIEGAFLDKYVISHFKDLFPNNQFKVDEVVSQDKMAYGAVVNDTNLHQCFKKVMKHDPFLVYNFIRKGWHRTFTSTGSESVKNSQSIFDPTGALFYPSLYICVGLVVFIVAIGFFVHFFYLKPIPCVRNRTKSYDVKNAEVIMKPVNTKELEKEMMNEINEIIKKYQDKIKLAENFYRMKET